MFSTVMTVDFYNSNFSMVSFSILTALIQNPDRGWSVPFSPGTVSKALRLEAKKKNNLYLLFWRQCSLTVSAKMPLAMVLIFRNDFSHSCIFIFRFWEKHIFYVNTVLWYFLKMPLAICLKEYLWKYFKCYQVGSSLWWS